MLWSHYDIPGGDWRPKSPHTEAYYADRMERLGMAGNKANTSDPRVAEQKTDEMLQILGKLGWPATFGHGARLSDGYLPLLELVIQGLYMMLPEEEASRHHDDHGLALATHKRLEGRVLHPDGWYRRWEWMPQAHESVDAYREALMGLVVECRIGRES